MSLAECLVSYLAPGWALTISLEPTFEVRDRCGLSTSTRMLTVTANAAFSVR